MTREGAAPECQQEGGGSVEARSAGSCNEARVSDGTWAADAPALCDLPCRGLLAAAVGTEPRSRGAKERELALRGGVGAGESQEKQYRRILLLEHEPAAPDEPVEDGDVALQQPASAASSSPPPATAGSTRHGRKRRAVSFDHPLLARARQLEAERASLIDEYAAGSSEAEPEEAVPQPSLERRFSRVEAHFSSPRSTGSIVSQAAADTPAPVPPRSPAIRHWSIPCSPADSHRLPPTNSSCFSPSTLPSLGDRHRESAVAIARRPPTDDKMLLLPPLAVRLVNTSAEKVSEVVPPDKKRTSPARMSGSAGHGLRPSRDLSGQETQLDSRMHNPHVAAACTS